MENATHRSEAATIQAIPQLPPVVEVAGGHLFTSLKGKSSCSPCVSNGSQKCSNSIWMRSVSKMKANLEKMESRQCMILALHYAGASVAPIQNAPLAPVQLRSAIHSRKFARVPRLLRKSKITASKGYSMTTLSDLSLCVPFKKG